MKRIYALLAVACALLAGCNKDKDGISDRPETGFYLYESATITVRLYLDNSVSLAIYENGLLAYSPASESTLADAGTWPSYIFEFTGGTAHSNAGEDLTLSCLFTDSTHFTGTVIKNSTSITLPSVMQFSLSSNPDLNSDGLLDSWQSEFIIQ